MLKMLQRNVFHVFLLLIALFFMASCGSDSECVVDSIEISDRKDLEDHGDGANILGALPVLKDCSNGACLEIGLDQSLEATVTGSNLKDSVSWALRGPDGEERITMEGDRFSYQPNEPGTWLLMARTCAENHSWYIRVVAEGTTIQPEPAVTATVEVPNPEANPAKESKPKTAASGTITAKIQTEEPQKQKSEPKDRSKAFKSTSVASQPDTSSATWVEQAVLQMTATSNLSLNSFYLWVAVDEDASATITVQADPPSNRITLTPARTGRFIVSLNSFNLDLNTGESVRLTLSTEGCRLLALPVVASDKIPLQMNVLQGRNVLGELSGNRS